MNFDGKAKSKFFLKYSGLRDFNISKRKIMKINIYFHNFKTFIF